MKLKATILAAVLVVLGAVGVAFAATADLGGTSWKVVGYNNGSYNTLTPVMNSDAVRVVFGRDGKMSAMSGRNGYTANYSVVGAGQRTLRISKPAATASRVTYATTAERAQETAIMRAMNSATHFRLAGGQLDLLRNDGSLAATLLTTDEATVIARREAILDRNATTIAHVRAAEKMPVVRTASIMENSTMPMYSTTSMPTYVNTASVNSIAPCATTASMPVVRTASVETRGVQSYAVNVPVAVPAPEVRTVNVPATIPVTEVTTITVPSTIQAAEVRTVNRSALEVISTSCNQYGQYEASQVVRTASVPSVSRGTEVHMVTIPITVPAPEVRTVNIPVSIPVTEVTTATVPQTIQAAEVRAVGTTDMEVVRTASVVAEPTFVRTASVSTMPVERVTVWRSGNREARFENANADMTVLYIDGEAHNLRRVMTNNGTSFVSVDDPRTVVWDRGDRRVITVRGVEYPDFVVVR